MISDEILEAAYALALKQTRARMKRQNLWPSTPHSTIIFTNGPHTRAMLVDKYFSKHKERLLVEARSKARASTNQEPK